MREAGGAVGCQLDEVFELGLGFDVEVGDAGVEGVEDFEVGFADAGEDDFCGVAACLEDAVEFAAADDVESAAVIAEESEDVDIAAGLDGVADHGVEIGVGVLDFAEVVEEGGLAVDVGGRAEFPDDEFDVGAFDEESAVFVFEVVHRLFRRIGGASPTLQLRRIKLQSTICLGKTTEIIRGNSIRNRAAIARWRFGRVVHVMFVGERSFLSVRAPEGGVTIQGLESYEIASSALRPPRNDTGP